MREKLKRGLVVPKNPVCEMRRHNTFSPSVCFACGDKNAVRSTRRLL